MRAQNAAHDMKPDLASGDSNVRRQFLLAAAIAVIAFAAYLPAMRGGFVWDDSSFLTGNKLIKASDGLRRFWFTTESPDYFPLTSSMLWVEWRLWGPHATGYHIVNVLLHAIGAVLLWRALRRLKVPGAWLAGILFAVHPVGAASAAWITEGKNTLPMVFYLLSLLAYFTYQEREAKRWYAVALALFLLALLAKSSVVMLPAVLLLCGWWRRGTLTRKDLLRSAPFFALSLALGLVTVWFQHHNIIAGAPVRPEGAASRVAAAGWILWFYLFKLLVPAGLCAVYPRWSVDGASLPAFLPLALFIAGMAWLWMRRKSWGRAPLFTLAYFALSLLPVLGFVDMAFMEYSLVADHFQYIAMAGIVAFAAAIIAWAVGASRSPKWAAVPAAGCAVALGILTWGRGALYGDEARLWEDNLAKNRAAWVAWNNLGLERNREGRPMQAIACFDESLKWCPAYTFAYNNRARVLAGMGRYELALRDYASAIEINPDYADAYVNRCAAYAALKRYDEALRDCERAIQLKPADAKPYNNRGVIRATQGRYDLALAEYDHAIALDAEDPETWLNRGLAHAALRRLDLAIGDYDRAIELNPDFVQARYFRGRACLATGRFAEAIRDCDAVIALKPDSAEAYNNRAIAWAKTGGYGEAVRDWTQAIALKPDYAEAYYHRALLYSDMKKYDQALADVRAFEKLGGHPDPGFVKRLTDAVGRAE
jgi:tetratricopeptide (TPR) repeat protein